MTKRKVWRYKCDHCRKSGCSGGAMKAHECRCFKNPERLCSMCHTKWPYVELIPIMKELEEIEESTEEVLTQKVRNAVEGCPACMCAVFMQAKLPTITYERGTWDGSSLEDGSYRYHVKFNYAKERDEYLKERWSEEVSDFSIGTATVP